MHTLSYCMSKNIPTHKGRWVEMTIGGRLDLTEYEFLPVRVGGLKYK